MAYTTIDDPEKYFKPVKYVGNLLQHPVEGFNHQPDWLWFKNADTTNSHNLLDSTRGTDKTLEGTNNNNAEGDTTTRLDSFDSDGFTVETDPSVNGNNNEIVVFSWAANGGSVTNVAESGDNPGFSRQTSTTAGFSIIKYTGTGAVGTIAHGLGIVPDFIIIKRLENADNWRTYDSAGGGTKAMRLNLNGGHGTSSSFYNDTDATSSVFTVGTNSEINGDAETYIAYVFGSVKGYSKIGSYVGNGNADGPLVYTGFKPSWVMVKKSNGGSHDWYIQYGNTTFDDVSQAANPVKSSLIANSSGAKATENSMDFVNDGFKLRTSGNGHNTSGHTYIYMAFAQNPLVNSNGIPGNAH